jgi:hypothetical protein
MKKIFIILILISCQARSQCPFDSTSFPCITYAGGNAQWSLDGYNTVYWLKQIAHKVGITSDNIGPSPSCPFDSTAFPYQNFSCQNFTQWSLDGYNTVYWLKQIAYNIKGSSSGLSGHGQFPAITYWTGTNILGQSPANFFYDTVTDRMRQSFSNDTSQSAINIQGNNGLCSIRSGGVHPDFFQVKDSDGANFIFSSGNLQFWNGSGHAITFTMPNKQGDPGDVLTMGPNPPITIWASAPVTPCLNTITDCGNGMKPTLSDGAGIATGATEVDTSFAITGVIYVTTGTVTNANSTIFIYSYPVPFSTFSTATVTPANENAAALGTLSVAKFVYPQSSTTQFRLVAGTLGLTPSTTYAWHYIIAGY